jgi:hypothetical protein
MFLVGVYRTDSNEFSLMPASGVARELPTPTPGEADSPTAVVELLAADGQRVAEHPLPIYGLCGAGEPISDLFVAGTVPSNLLTDRLRILLPGMP